MTVRMKRTVPVFTVADVVRTAHYYRDTLGFEIHGFWDGEESSMRTDPPPFFAIVWRDDVSIYFSRAEGSVGSQADYTFYVHLDDVDAYTEEIRARGAEILDGPEDKPYGRREILVRDCEGRLISFGSPTS